MPYKNKEKEKASQARYRAAHREELKARQAAYIAAHREEDSARNARYRAAHREEVKVYMDAYCAAHREEKKAYYTTHRAESVAAAAVYKMGLSIKQIPDQIREGLILYYKVKQELKSLKEQAK
jgi:crotonobetainyl-CoA:carnitine CoA-transferase CaiB-like acyl-CoA transferase